MLCIRPSLFRWNCSSLLATNNRRASRRFILGCCDILLGLPLQIARRGNCSSGYRTKATSTRIYASSTERDSFLITFPLLFPSDLMKSKFEGNSIFRSEDVEDVEDVEEIYFRRAAISSRVTSCCCARRTGASRGMDGARVGFPMHRALTNS